MQEALQNITSPDKNYICGILMSRYKGGGTAQEETERGGEEEEKE